MIATARKVLFLFAPRDKRHLALLLLMLILMAITDVVGVASIMPFMAIVARPDAVQGDGLLGAAYRALGFESTLTFLVAAGIATLLALIVANAVAALGNWMLYRFTYTRGHELARRLLAHYMAQPYSFFLQRNSTTLSKNIMAEVNRVNVGVLVPWLQMLAKLAVAAMLVAVLLAADPLLAVCVAVVVICAYAVVYIALRRRLTLAGRESTVAGEHAHRITTEALSGIKDIKLAGREPDFVARFEVPSRRMAQHAASAQSISLLPRYALETIAFGGMLMTALYLVITRGDAASVIPTVGLYAFAGYRLMPALQQIYSSLSAIRYNASALDLLYDELGAGDHQLPPAAPAPMPFIRDIRFDGVSFAYAARDPILRNISLTIEANTTIALTGASGAGKSTLIDLLLGLLTPQDGRVLIDGVPLTPANVRAWQRNLGYVPQQIHLSDDTLEANIALGVPTEKIDRSAVVRAARLAHLDDFARTLPQGYDTAIGERGVTLSGGQRQRIGIARALYADPPVIVLDEATSALDGITEGAIMDAIAQLAHRKTIVIIAHRLSTVQLCDVIHLVDHGRVVASGTYTRLLQESRQFQELAAMAVSGELP